MKAYLDTAREVLDKGTRKENRTGIDTISTFNINCEIELEANKISSGSVELLRSRGVVI